MKVGERFGENIALARERASMSRRQLSRLTGIQYQEVGRLEKGGRLPRIDTLLKLAGALEVTPNDLLAGMSFRPIQTVEGAFEIESDEGSR